jgi:hypothetical protein
MWRCARQSRILRRELGEVESRERRLLALYLDQELASLSGLKDESDTLARRKVGLNERLAAAGGGSGLAPRAGGDAGRDRPRMPGRPPRPRSPRS